MTDRKYYLWLIPGVLLLGMALVLVLTFQPVLAGSAQAEVNSVVEDGLQRVSVQEEVIVPLAAVDPVCTLDTTDALAYWPLDETTGETFSDAVASYDGTCSGSKCPSSITGTNNGGQFFLDTESDVINVGSDPIFDFQTTDNFSVGIWVKTTQNCTGNKVFIGRYKNLVEEGRWWLGCQQSGGIGVARFHMRDSNGVVARSAIGSTQINDGNWHYLVGVWDGTNTKLFVGDADGGATEEASVNSPPFTGHFESTEPITIGAFDEDTVGYYVNGTLDEAAVFDVALSENFIDNYLTSSCTFNWEVGDVTFDTSKNTAIPITAAELLANTQGGLTLSAVDTSSKHGSISGASPNFTYNPNLDYVGSDFFTFEVTDGFDTARGTAIITMETPEVTNPGPQTDFEGAAVSLQIEATDPNGDDLTYEATSLPAGLTIDADTGLISGNVGAGASAGSPYDPVTVTVTDIKDFSAFVEFVWTIDPNAIPEVAPIGDQSNAEGETITPVQVVASDGDSDVLTYDATNLPPGLSINSASGLISGTVSAGAAAASPYSVVVTVDDGKAAPVEAPFTWTISGENNPPVVTNPGAQSNFEGDAISLQVVATDPDGDELTYSMTGQPPGLSINPATGLITGTISAGASDFSPYTVTVKAEEKLGTLFDEETFNWTVLLAKYIYLPLILNSSP